MSHLILDLDIIYSIPLDLIPSILLAGDTSNTSAEGDRGASAGADASSSSAGGGANASTGDGSYNSPYILPD